MPPYFCLSQVYIDGALESLGMHLKDTAKKADSDRTFQPSHTWWGEGEGMGAEQRSSDESVELSDRLRILSADPSRAHLMLTHAWPRHG